jgi:hypothetical protein
MLLLRTLMTEKSFLLYAIYISLHIFLDIRTAITHFELDEDSFFNESDTKDVLFL